MKGARIIGVGQPLAGDDGVGLAVVEHLRARGVPAGVELCLASEAAALVELCAHDGPVVIVDALLAPPPGRVCEVDGAALEDAGFSPLSSHGVGLREAIELARALAPGRFTPRLALVGVTIAWARPGARRLSISVAAAVPRAATLALTLAAPPTAA